MTANTLIQRHNDSIFEINETAVYGLARRLGEWGNRFCAAFGVIQLVMLPVNGIAGDAFPNAMQGRVIANDVFIIIALP